MISAPLFSAVVLVGVLAFLEIGRRLGRRRATRDPDSIQGTSAVEGMLYGLLGLLIAFTFNGAADRFQGRRVLMGQEANAIGTAYRMIDVVPDPARTTLKTEFRAYVDSRLATYRKLPDVDAALAELPRTHALQDQIWRDAVDGLKLPGAPPPQAVLPRITEMFDAETTQLVATQVHPAPIIYVMLGTLSMVASLLAGFAAGASRHRHVLHSVVFALTLAVTTFVILDVEYPVIGTIRVHGAERVLVDLRDHMN